MHLSRQQRSGWKQNHTREDTCTWANPLAGAKESFSRTLELSHLRISSSYCGAEERSLQFAQSWATRILCALWRAVNGLFLSQVETRQQFHRKKVGLVGGWLRVSAALTRLLCGIQRAPELGFLWHSGLRYSSRSSSARLYLQALLSAMCLDLHWCEGTRVHPTTTPTSWRCWISAATDSWHHAWTFILCSSMPFV